MPFFMKDHFFGNRLVDMIIDQGRLVEKIDQLQIDREYLEDSGGEYLIKPSQT